MMPVSINNKPAVAVIKSKIYTSPIDDRISYRNWRIKLSGAVKRVISPAKTVFRFVPKFFKEWGSRVVRRDKGTHLGLLLCGVVPWVWTTLVVDPIMAADVAMKFARQRSVGTSMDRTDYSDSIAKGSLSKDETLKDLREGMHPDAIELLKSRDHQGVFKAFVLYENENENENKDKDKQFKDSGC